MIRRCVVTHAPALMLVIMLLLVLAGSFEASPLCRCASPGVAVLRGRDISVTSFANSGWRGTL
jgi:hypothetical protein